MPISHARCSLFIKSLAVCNLISKIPIQFHHMQYRLAWEWGVEGAQGLQVMKATQVSVSLLLYIADSNFWPNCKTNNNKKQH